MAKDKSSCFSQAERSAVQLPLDWLYCGVCVRWMCDRGTLLIEGCVRGGCVTEGLYCGVCVRGGCVTGGSV